MDPRAIATLQMVGLVGSWEMDVATARLKRSGKSSKVRVSCTSAELANIKAEGLATLIVTDAEGSLGCKIESACDATKEVNASSDRKEEAETF